MRRVLALDTTGKTGSLALLLDGKLVEEKILVAADGFGTVLFPSIDDLLKRHGVTIREIDCFAAASGPGSFTGVRAGLTAVKGLGEALGRSAVGVSTLQALAWHGQGELRAAVLDARRGEVYGALYDAALNLIQEEIVMPFPAWRAGLPRGVCFVGQNLTPFADQIPGEPMIDGVPALAGAVAYIAAAVPLTDPAELDANYVRRSDAELFWKE